MYCGLNQSLTPRSRLRELTALFSWILPVLPSLRLNSGILNKADITLIQAVYLTNLTSESRSCSQKMSISRSFWAFFRCFMLYTPASTAAGITLSPNSSLQLLALSPTSWINLLMLFRLLFETLPSIANRRPSCSRAATSASEFRR